MIGLSILVINKWRREVDESKYNKYQRLLDDKEAIRSSNSYYY